MGAGGLLDQIRRTAEQTPEDRERHVDLVRAVSITLVVLGHWLVVVIVDDDGLDGVNAIGEVGWFHPLTWVFQVMPLFFFVGGYANAASLMTHRRRGGDEWLWVADRFRRIVLPTAALLATLVVAVVVARIGGAPTGDVSQAAWFVTLPLWFLLAYLAVCAMAPVLVRADERFGLSVPVALGVLVVTADVVGLTFGIDLIRQPNHLLVYVAFHQLGAAWRHGALRPTPTVGVPLMALSLATAIGLVALGPYPVAMVDEPGAALQNTTPPTLAYFCLGIAQIGLVLAVRNQFVPWLDRGAVWVTVVALNGMILTLFLWHVAAALLAGLALHGVGLLPEATIGSAQFMVLRLPWIGASLVVLAVLVMLLAPIERAVAHRTDAEQRLPAAGRAVLAAGVTLLLASMVGIAATGPSDEAHLGLPAWSVALFTFGVAALVGGRRLQRPGHT